MHNLSARAEGLSQATVAGVKLGMKLFDEFIGGISTTQSSKHQAQKVH